MLRFALDDLQFDKFSGLENYALEVCGRSPVGGLHPLLFSKISYKRLIKREPENSC